MQWVPAALSPGIEQPGHEADHSLPSSAQVKITGKDEDDLECKIMETMKELETWFQYNNLIINTKKTSAMSFHLRQWREPLRQQTVFKNIEIGYQSELTFLGIHMTETLKWCAHAQVLKAKLCKVVYIVKILKETMCPYMIRIMYFFKFWVRYGIMLWGGDRASDSTIKPQKRVLRVICGVSSCTSCRQIFKDYSVLTLPSL
jgi:dsDNA-binding SOS-regulon protein